MIYNKKIRHTKKAHNSHSTGTRSRLPAVALTTKTSGKKNLRFPPPGYGRLKTKYDYLNPGCTVFFIKKMDNP